MACPPSTRRLLVWSAVSLAMTLLVSVERIHAQTPRIQGQATAAAGMGNAFVAQADDASALHYNPAGMTQLHGVHILTGALFVGGTINFTSSSTGQNTTGNLDGSAAWPPPAHFYLVANLKDIGLNALENWTAGVGVTVPFGSLTRYPTNSPFSSAVYFNTNPLLDIKPTVAYKLNDYLSFGLGADIYTYSALFGEGQVEVMSTGANNGLGPQFELNGSGTGAGFNASVLYTPLRNADGLPIANIGFVYRSQAVVPLSGQFAINGTLAADARANLVLPQIFTGGIAIWPVRDRKHEWKLELDVDYVGWKSFRDTTVSLSRSVPGIGSGIPVRQNWSNSYTLMIGTEYRFLRLERLPDWEVALRAGFTQAQTQVPDTTFNPGIPSANVYTPGVGFGFTCKAGGSFLGLTRCGNLGVGNVKPKEVGLDISYQAAIYETRTITGNVNPAVNGTYKTLFHAGGVSLRFSY
jgi:long-chain fatty acid transport protein